MLGAAKCARRDRRRWVTMCPCLATSLNRGATPARVRLWLERLRNSYRQGGTTSGWASGRKRCPAGAAAGGMRSIFLEAVRIGLPSSPGGQTIRASPAAGGFGPAGLGLETVGAPPPSGPVHRSPSSTWSRYVPRWRPRTRLGLAIRNRLYEWSSVLNHRILR